MRFFIHDPEYCHTEFHATQPDLEKAMDDYDLLGNHCDDGWSEAVENVIAGFIPDGVTRVDDEESDDWEDEYDFYSRHATHQATMFDEKKRPDNIDEDGYSPDGEYWGEWDYRCNYRFEAIKK